MKAPRGAVAARTAAKKRRIWSHPLAVKAASASSEPLGLQEGVGEVHEQGERQQQSDDVIGSQAITTPGARGRRRRAGPGPRRRASRRRERPGSRGRRGEHPPLDPLRPARRLGRRARPGGRTRASGQPSTGRSCSAPGIEGRPSPVKTVSGEGRGASRRHQGAAEGVRVWTAWACQRSA